MLNSGWRVCGFILLFITFSVSTYSQTASLEIPDTATSKKKWQVTGFGVNWNPGPTQFFEGYTWELMQANSSSGLPLLPQWELFTGATVASTHFQAGERVYILDTSGTFRLRASLSYARRTDSLFYNGPVANDTIEGRAGKEISNFIAAGFSTIKSTRKLAGFLRLYAGAEMELALSPRSVITFWQWQVDFGEQQYVLEPDRFDARGRPRFTAFAFAQLGFEIYVLKSIAFNFEGRSGIGAHLVVRETPVGLSKTQLSFGLNVYPFGRD